MKLLNWVSICWGRSVDWGSVAEWVGGIGTTGALLLGLGILRRDHANSQRSLINQVGWWFGAHKNRWGCNLANQGALPVHVWVEPAMSDEPLFFTGPLSTGVVSPDGYPVGPGETISFRTADSRPSEDALVRRVVVMDNAGRQWEHQQGRGWVEVPRRRRKSVPGVRD